jgi:hypothetical protein
MTGNYEQKIGFYNVSKSLTDSIEIFSITSRYGLVDISKSNFLIDAISEDSVSLTFDVDEILLNKDTINVSSSEGDFLITFFILGKGTITAIEQNSIETPNQYELYQNFPNPFNPSTKIRYSVPQSSTIVIKVFDILGNEIETLVDEEKFIGTYELTWNAERLPSGIYFYKLQSGSFVETKKMVLMK